MEDYANSDLLEAFINHLGPEFDELSRLLNSRNSRSASKDFRILNPA